MENRKRSLTDFFLLFCAFLHVYGLAVAAAASLDATKPPNVLILFVDDMGYGDLGCQGNETVSSPRIDALAEEGIRFTQWLSADSICTPSRGALLTGRLPIRLGLASGVYYQRVLQPLSPGGLPHSEHTLAEALKERGYATHLTGKWHLGVGKQGEYLPTQHGFDHFYGMGITNVQSCMPGKTIYETDTLAEFIFWNTSPVWVGMAAASLLGYLTGFLSTKTLFATSLSIVLLFSVAVFIVSQLTLMSSTMCILYKDTEIIQQPIQLQNLTQRNTANALGFLSHAVSTEKPFFLLMSYVKLHTALFSNPEMKMKDDKAFPEYEYVNNIRELDWSVGKLVDYLKETEEFDNTIIWLTSDNGPFLERGVEGGSKSFLVEENGKKVEKQLRAGKGTVWEGGIRVPGLGVYKELFPQGIVSNEPVSTMDIYPTTMSIVDNALQRLGKLPATRTYVSEKGAYAVKDKIIDGKDLFGMITALKKNDKAASSPHSAMMHYCGDVLSAVRLNGRYKAYFYTPVFDAPEEAEICTKTGSCQCQGGAVNAHDPPLLFDLDQDIEEKTALTMETFPNYEKIIEQVSRAVEEHRLTISRFPNQESEVKKMQVPWLFPELCCSFPSCKCDTETDPGLYFYN